MSARQKMPSVDLINFQGLYTKQNPETLSVTQLRECKNVDFFREYGSLSKMRGNTRVLSEQYSESAVTKGIYWGGFYKSQDLTGAIDRQVIIGAGTSLRKIESNGTTTELLAGEPDELFRTSGQLDRFMYITSQDTFNVGKRGQMSKFDGTRISQWGLNAPGDQEILFTDGGSTETSDTPIQNFDDHTVFTESNSTASSSSVPAWRGTSTAMLKGTASTAASIELLNTIPFFINSIVEDRAKMQVFIPREDYRKLATSGRAISVYIGSEATLASNYYRYDFQIGRLFEGWNTLVFDFSTFPSGDFGATVGTPDDDNLASYRFEVLTNNASDTLTAYWDRFVSLDQGAPSTELADAGGSVFVKASTSTWNYRVTFGDDAGLESNAGPSISQSNTTGSIDYGSISLTNIPVSTNPSVVKRFIYRTVASGSTYLFLTAINDNVTTTFSDTTSDTSLGADQPPLLGDLIFDHAPPPSGGITLVWKRTAFVAGDPLNPNILAFSRFNIPQAFPINNAIEFDERITGLFSTYLGIVVTTETAFHRILGDNPDYTVDKVVSGFGGVGPRAVGTGREIGWAVDRDGMRLYDLREAIKISEVIRDRVDGFDKSALEDAHTAHSKKDNAILWLTKDSDGVYSDIYSYSYSIDEIRKGSFSQIIPNPTSFNIQAMWEIEDSDGDFKLYAATKGGMVHEMLSENSLNWLDDQGQSRPVNFEMRTAFMRLGATEESLSLTGTSGRITPRYIELRATEATGLAHTWTVVVESGDSPGDAVAPRGSKTMTFDFLAGQGLMRLSVQDMTSAEYLRLTITNTQKDVDVALTGVKVYYNVRPGQFQVEGVSGGGVLGAAGQN